MASTATARKVRAPAVSARGKRAEEYASLTGEEMKDARRKLGLRWGFGRPLHGAELGRALRLTGRDPGATIYDWERRDTISGPVSVAIEMMLAGALPPDGLEKIRKRD